MKLSLRLGVLSALATVAALAAMPASADLALGDNAELQLVVRNLSSPSAAYVRGLGISLNDIMNQAATQSAYTGPVQTFSYSLPTFSADSNLTSFLGQSAALGFTWTVMAADTSGVATSFTTASQTGARRAVFATQVDAPSIQNTQLTTIMAASNYTNFGGEQNSALDGVALSGDSSTAGGWGSPSFTFGADATTFFNVVGLENAVSDTGSANFYLAANNSGAGLSATSQVRLFQFTDLRLAANGTLSSLAVSEVPLPAAFWLLGSGLLGAMGIGRRRQAVAA